MNDYQPLACDLYDYLEIACLHRYRLDIELVDGAPVSYTHLDVYKRQL